MHKNIRGMQNILQSYAVSLKNDKPLYDIDGNDGLSSDTSSNITQRDIFGAIWANKHKKHKISN